VNDTVSVPGLSAEESAALEALFTQDLPGERAASVKPKLGRSLVAKGYADPAELVIGRGALAAKVKTFKITLAGSLAYCAACAGMPNDV
jgi:hypothetical protein